jgi:hypothetical protein
MQQGIMIEKSVAKFFTLFFGRGIMKKADRKAKKTAT